MALLTGQDRRHLVEVAETKQVRTTRRKYVASGVHYWSSTTTSVAAAAQAATAGFYYCLNPVGSGASVQPTRIDLTSMALAVSATPTRITVERFSFLGFPTSTPYQATSRRDTTDPPPTMLITNGATGFNPSTFVPWLSFLLSSGITAAEDVVPQQVGWASRGATFLLPGEGLVIRQPDAGVTSDPRRFVINMAWREIPLSQMQ